MVFGMRSRGYFLCFSVILKICVNDIQVWFTNSSCYHKRDKVLILVHFESFKKSPNCLNRNCKHETRYTHVHVCIIVCIILSWYILRMVLFFVIYYKCDAMRGSRKHISRRGGGVRGIILFALGGGKRGVVPRHIFGILSSCRLNKLKLFRRDPLPDPHSGSAHECVSSL